MTLEDAIARSISRTEIVHCEFAGDYSDLKAWLNDNISVESTVSEESDGTIDVAGDDWRVNVTLVAEYKFATDSETGTITAGSFSEACVKLEAMVGDADGGTGWVEDESGDRFEIAN